MKQKHVDKIIKYRHIRQPKEIFLLCAPIQCARAYLRTSEVTWVRSLCPIFYAQALDPLKLLDIVGNNRKFTNLGLSGDQ